MVQINDVQSGAASEISWPTGGADLQLETNNDRSTELRLQLRQAHEN